MRDKTIKWCTAGIWYPRFHCIQMCCPCDSKFLMWFFSISGVVSLPVERIILRLTYFCWLRQRNVCYTFPKRKILVYFLFCWVTVPGDTATAVRGFCLALYKSPPLSPRIHNYCRLSVSSVPFNSEFSASSWGRVSSRPSLELAMDDYWYWCS